MFSLRARVLAHTASPEYAACARCLAHFLSDATPSQAVTFTFTHTPSPKWRWEHTPSPEGTRHGRTHAGPVLPVPRMHTQPRALGYAVPHAEYSGGAEEHPQTFPQGRARRPLGAVGSSPWTRGLVQAQRSQEGSCSSSAAAPLGYPAPEASAPRPGHSAGPKAPKVSPGLGPPLTPRLRSGA